MGGWLEPKKRPSAAVGQTRSAQTAHTTLGWLFVAGRLTDG